MTYIAVQKQAFLWLKVKMEKILPDNYILNMLLRYDAW